MGDLDYLTEFCTEQHFDFINMPLFAGSTVIEVHQFLQCVDPPFWAFVWPGGQALAQYTMTTDLVRGKHVLDIGPGVGVNSIAAARGGAASVTAVDIEPMSADLTELNAQINGYSDIITTAARHVGNDELRSYDVILMGDCFYDGEASYELNKLVDVAVDLGIPFYTGDPKREHFPIRRATYLEQYGIPNMATLEGKATVTAYVFELGHI